MLDSPPDMKVATTIQISSEEDREIARLKEVLGFASKKAVILEGLRALNERLQELKRRHQLQKASQLVRQESSLLNKEWAPLSAALKKK